MSDIDENEVPKFEDIEEDDDEEDEDDDEDDEE